LALDIDSIAGLIAETQLPGGEIPWSAADKTDPWDHVEATMGLTIGGRYGQAVQAFEWIANQQLTDGSWFAAYRNGEPVDKTRDANQTTYIAVGLFHYFLVTRDTRLLARMWPVIRSAIDFAIRLQAPGGEIYWAISPDDQVDQMALLTGSSSIYMSIKCAIAIGRHLGQSMPVWETVLERLGYAIRNKPMHFNRLVLSGSFRSCHRVCGPAAHS
jgi:hypothetical protein